MDYLQTDALSVGYNGKTLISKVALSVQRGRIVTLIGPNGSGKSTLMKIIAGLEKNFQGEVVFSPGYTVGYLEQEPLAHEERTVREVVEDGVPVQRYWIRV